MSTVIPEGKNVEKAIKWISASIEENENQSIPQLVDKAVFKFDLSPKDSQFILGFFRDRQAEK